MNHNLIEKLDCQSTISSTKIYHKSCSHCCISKLFIAFRMFKPSRSTEAEVFKSSYILLSISCFKWKNAQSHQLFCQKRWNFENIFLQLWRFLWNQFHFKNHQLSMNSDKEHKTVAIPNPPQEAKALNCFLSVFHFFGWNGVFANKNRFFLFFWRNENLLSARLYLFVYAVK